MSTPLLTQGADDAHRFAWTRETYLRALDNDERTKADEREDKALATYDLAIADARHILAGIVGADPEQQAEGMELARARIERAGLDVCRALGEA